MSIETNLNQSPYFDDFDENKNFHRVLFRPGFAVQARELTQLQTILQNQIQRFANEIMVDGTVVSGVGIRTDNKLSYVKLRDKDANNRVLLLSDFFINGVLANATVTGVTSGMTAQLIDVKEGSEVAAPNYLSIFVKYTNSGANNTTKEFSDNETLILRTVSTNQFVVAANTIQTNATGYGFGASVTDGIVYHKGNFIRVPSQRITVDKFNDRPSKKLGFETREFIIDSNQDSSLLDNATGSTNFSAPGADRLKLIPTLAVRDINANTANTTTFYTIGRIENGLLVIKSLDTIYADIGKHIAEKLYETHGNYAVDPFNIRIREHIRNQNNLGKYNDGDSNKLVAEVEKGIGYVNGTKVSILASVYRDVDKAIDFDVKDARVIGHTIGSYVFAREVVGTWNFKGLRTVNLYNAVQRGITSKNLASRAAQGTLIGTARVRGIQYHSGTSGTALGQFRIYLFDIKMNSGQSFSSVRGMRIENGISSGNHSMADIVLENNIAVLQEPGLSTLVFPFAQRGTKTLKDRNNNVDTQFVFRTENSVTFATNGTATVSANGAAIGGTETLNDTGSPLTNVDERNIIIVARATTQTAPHTGKIDNYSGNTVNGSGTQFITAYRVGDFIRITHGANTFTERITQINSATQLRIANTIGVTAAGKSLPHRTVFPAGYIFDLSSNGTITSTSTTHSIDLKVANLESTMAATVYFNVLRSSAVQSNKVVNKDKFIRINTATNTASKNGPWSLGVSDAYKIVAVYLGSNTSPTESNVNVTSEFELDTGMKDSFYDTAFLRKKSTSTLNTTNVGLLVKFNYFARNYSSGIGFLSVDSYPIDDTNTANTTAITTQEIPIFVSPTTGKTFDLRDSIDYRPIRTNTVTPSSTVSGAPVNPASSTAFDITSDGSYCPAPDENFQADIQFYIPRIDRICLNKDGVIEVIKGVPSLNPKTPDEKFGTMTLGTLEIPVYPSLSPYVAKLFNRLDYQVRLSVVNNRRYTMKDLRGIEQRVKNLEYYSSLNALESSAKNKQLFNNAGNDRFKNGFLVDNFDGHNVADLNNVGYRAAIDRYATTLRPTFNKTIIPLRYSSSIASTGVTKTGELITLNYTNVPFLTQPYASKQRNCVQELTFNWRGEVILDPSMDNTPDITTLPDIQVDFDGMYEAIEEIATRAGIVGTDWGDWRTTNTDVTRDRQSTTRGTIQTTITTTTTVTDRIREGLQTTISPSTENFSLGNFVTNVAVRDYMRSRLIRFTGIRLKPNTRVYAYFDDELVSRYCTPTNSSFSNTNLEGSSLITDSTGSVYGVFRLPNDDRLKFRVGTKRFELKDIANTQTQSSLITTSGHGDYTSISLDISERGAGFNIKVPQFQSEEKVETDTVTTVTVRRNVTDLNPPPPPAPNQNAYDPLAQTFYISSPSRTDGVFITKVDLFFARKSDTYPITLQIRETVNGYPSNVIVPYGEKTLYPDQINANSVSSSTETSFIFDSPVFLQNNKEYALVAIPGADNDEYILWVAELGGIDITTNALIDKQPASGVMLTSANDRTWGAIQSEDVKYTIHRAEFSTTPGTIYVENDDIDIFSYDNVSGSFNIGEKIYSESVLRFANNRTISVGDILQSKAARDGSPVTNANYANGVIRQIISSSNNDVFVKVDNFKNFPINVSANVNNLFIGTTWVGNTIAFSANNRSGFISFIDEDNRKIHIEKSTGSFANGFIRGQITGASARVTVVDNVSFNAIVPKIPQVLYSNTSIDWEARTTSTGGVISQSYSAVDISVDNEIFDAEKRLFGKTNENPLSAVGGSKKTLVLRGNILTDDSFVSPVIDTSRTNAILIKNNINNSSTDEHKDVGASQVRYISRPVELRDGQEAEDLSVFITAYKPQGTDVKVYARIHNPEDSESFSQKDFTPLRQVTSSNTFSDSVNREDFREFEFTFSANTDGQNFLASSNSHAYLNTSNNEIVAYRAKDGSIYHTYKTFSIKIVLNSTGTNIIPLVQDMRAIALQK
jgi:hypothetical protein